MRIPCWNAIAQSLGQRPEIGRDATVRGSIAAVCGKTEVMSVLNPGGHAIMSGTYTGHLIAVMGAIAAQTELARPGVYDHLNAVADQLYTGITEALRITGVPGVVQGIGGAFGLHLGVTSRRGTKGQASAWPRPRAG